MIEAAGSHVNEQVRTFSQTVTLVLRPVNSSIYFKFVYSFKKNAENASTVDVPFAGVTQETLRFPGFLATFAVYHKRYIAYFNIHKVDDLIVNCFFGHSPYLTRKSLARNKVANGVLRYEVRGVLYLQNVIRFHDNGPNVIPFTPAQKKPPFILRKYLTVLREHPLQRISAISVIKCGQWGWKFFSAPVWPSLRRLPRH